MSIKRSLKRLEAITGVSGANSLDGHLDAIAGILGTIDGTMWPIRSVGHNKANCAIQQHQKRYHTNGISFQGLSGGGSDRAWKSDERLRAALVDAGLITIQRMSKANAGIKITPWAEDAVRRACGLPSFRDAFIVFELLKLLPPFFPDGWVAESDLFNANYQDRTNGSDWGRDTELIVPLLVAGVVESHTSTNAHVFYRVSGGAFPDIQAKPI